jgi:peptide deformylase
MAVYQIVKLEDEVLRQKAKEVKEINNSIIKLLDNMADTMYDADGVGLAAPQIGISKRVIVVDVGEGLVELVNPVLLEATGECTDSEGCLSIPEVYGDVTRPEKVKVTGLNRKGEQVVYEADDLFARALQHEIDHLEGIVFTDKAQNIQKK